MNPVAGGAAISAMRADSYKIPTDGPEADGTMAWNATVLVVVDIEAGGAEGLGYTYTDSAAAALVRGALREAIEGRDCFDIPSLQEAMQRRVRNIGREGVAATAISAINVALWDLKAKLLGLPLAALLGRRREAVPIYGSGGFTTYSDDELREQLGGWATRDGCRWVKMKVGSDPTLDPHRVAVARRAIGDAGLFVDANGAYARKRALALAESYRHDGVTWFEEPVSSDDLAGLRLLRQRAPAAMEIAAGEYGYTLDYFRCMLAAGAVDVQQADATRCGGVSGFLAAAALCEAYHTDISGHCAPSLHLHIACAAPRLRHLEWFHDHVRIEHRLFDGSPTPCEGLIRPDMTRPGIGLVFKHQDAEQYRIG